MDPFLYTKTLIIELLFFTVFVAFVYTPYIGEFASFEMRSDCVDDLLQNDPLFCKNQLILSEHKNSIYCKVLHRYESRVVNLQQQFDHGGPLSL